MVLLPDSHGSRGAGSQCALRSRSIRNDRERVADADAARAWLQSQSWVAPDRVSLLGWSSGAIAALWTVRARPQPQAKDGPDFRSAVALYPGCRRLSNAAWSARVPTLILIGRADDQASAAICQQMVAGARGRSARVEIHVYPGAHHDFDHPEPAVAGAHRACLLGRRHAAACTAAPIRPPAPTRSSACRSGLRGKVTPVDRTGMIRITGSHCSGIMRHISNTATARIGEPVPPRHFIGRPMKVNWPLPSSASRLHRLSMWVMSSSRQAL